MKPFKFGFSCPSCKKNLQSEPKDSGTASHCPVCNYGITVPAAPPRPIGGWLTLIAMGYVLQLSVYFLLVVFGAFQLGSAPEVIIAALFVTPEIAIAGVGARAMYKKKKWFRWYYPASWAAVAMIYMVLAAIGRDPSAVAKAVTFLIYSGVWTAYFMKSQRVKETFIL